MRSWLFGGTGFTLQRLTRQGQAWVALNGEVVIYDLRLVRTGPQRSLG